MLLEHTTEAQRVFKYEISTQCADSPVIGRSPPVTEIMICATVVHLYLIDWLLE